MSTYRLSWTVGLVLLVLVADSVASDASSEVQRADDAVRTTEQIEADWLRQDQVRAIAVPSDGNVTPEEDAAGACDGAKNGSYGFHTAREDHPWWQIDLGRASPLDEVFVFNRCDGSPARAASLELLVSEDGTAWSTAYKHDGTPSLKTHVVTRHRQGRSIAGACATQNSELLAFLRRGHYDVELAADDWARLITWMDTYGQRQGAFSPGQEEQLRRLRQQVAALLTQVD